MSLQEPPDCPRRLQAVSNNCPIMAVVLVVWGVNWQLRDFSRHAQSASLGVGGRFVEARSVAFWVGQLGKLVLPAEL